MSRRRRETETISIKFPNLQKLADEGELIYDVHEIQRLKDEPNMIAWKSILECLFGERKSKSKHCKHLEKKYGKFMDIGKGDSCLVFQDDVLKQIFPRDSKMGWFSTNRHITALRTKMPHPYWTLNFHPHEYLQVFMNPHVEEIEELVEDVLDYQGAEFMNDAQFEGLKAQFKATLDATVESVFSKHDAKRQRRT